MHECAFPWTMGHFPVCRQVYMWAPFVPQAGLKVTRTCALI